MNLIGDGLVEAHLPLVLDLLQITLQKLTQFILLEAIPLMVQSVCFHLFMVEEHTTIVQILLTPCCGVQQLTITPEIENGETVFQTVFILWVVIRRTFSEQPY